MSNSPASPASELDAVAPAKDEGGSPEERREAAEQTVRARKSLADLLRQRFDIKSFSLTGLFVLAAFAALYFARVVIMPIVLAVLLSYLLAPIIRLAARFRIPGPLAASATLLIGLGLFAFAIVELSTPASGWLQKAPYSLRQVQEKLHAVSGPLGKVQAAAAEMEKMASAPAPGKAPQTVEVNTHRVSDLFFTHMPEMVATGLSTIVLLYFLLASNGMFLRKLIKIIPNFADKKRAVEIAREIENSISCYLGTVTLVNLGLGTCVTIAMWLLGLPNPILWGVMVAILHFVPYLGAMVGLVAMTLAALLSFDQVGHALACPGVYLVFAILEGQVVTPMMLGRSLTLNPVVILISLIFWGWIWGIPGALLAVPILAVFKILCDHVDPLRALGEFLSD